MSPDPRDPDYNTTDKTCPICWKPFTATGRQAKNRRYCTPECKRVAAARREVERAIPTPQPHGSPPPTAPVTAAPAPQLPMTAAHRDCPHCGGPVTIVALLTTPEAARPTMPLAASDGVIPLRR